MNSDNCLKPFIPAWMFEAKLTPHEGWILAYLWRCQNAKTKLCNPSAKTISEKTGISVRKVFLCLKGLSEKGLIVVESGCPNKSNGYTLVMHGMHTKDIYVLGNNLNTSNNLGMHAVHNLPRNENLGMLRIGDLHGRFLGKLMPSLSPNAYRDYRVEVSGDGYATIINIYGGKVRKEIPA